MTLQSKFNINDEVWFMYNHKYYKGIVVDIESWEDNQGFLYNVQYHGQDHILNQHSYEYELYSLEDKESIIETLFIY